MAKLLLLNFLTVAVLAVAIAVPLIKLNVDGEIAGAVLMIGAGISGLIGGELVARRLPPRQSR